MTNPRQKKRDAKYYLYYVPASIVLMILLTSLSLYFWVKRKHHRLSNERLLQDFNTTMTQPNQCAATMLEIIHQGKLSVIWKGTYCQRQVAIKTISKDYADCGRMRKIYL